LENLCDGSQIVTDFGNQNDNTFLKQNIYLASKHCNYLSAKMVSFKAICDLSLQFPSRLSQDPGILLTDLLTSYVHSNPK
jgi:hypothetical protein